MWTVLSWRVSSALTVAIGLLRAWPTNVSSVSAAGRTVRARNVEMMAAAGSAEIVRLAKFAKIISVSACQIVEDEPVAMMVVVVLVVSVSATLVVLSKGSVLWVGREPVQRSQARMPERPILKKGFVKRHHHPAVGVPQLPNRRVKQPGFWGFSFSGFWVYIGGGAVFRFKEDTLRNKAFPR